MVARPAFPGKRFGEKGNCYIFSSAAIKKAGLSPAVIKKTLRAMQPLRQPQQQP